jgi:hypothetical protein
MLAPVCGDPKGHDSRLAALQVVSCAARSWPDLDEAALAAASAAAITAVEAVEWVPIGEQDHLLAAKRPLLVGTADGLTAAERRWALCAAARELARPTTRSPSSRSTA